jgi:hypothetical protein
MPAQLHLQVPKSAWPDIQTLLGLQLDEIRRLVEFVETASPTPDLEDLAERGADPAGISAGKINAVLTLLISLKRLQYSLSDSPERVFDAFESALERGEFPEWGDGRSDAWKERRPLLVPLLQPDNAIAIMAKVRVLLFEAQCILNESMVLTDVRHIYNEAGDGILGGLVLHTMSLGFLEGDQTRQIHITMTSEDVTKLIAQLKRDQQKARVAIDFLGKHGMPELTPKRNIQI